MLISEVRYGKTALPECCRNVGMQTKEPFKSAMLKVFEKMQENSGEGFQEVFCSHMERAMENTALEKEEKEEFLRFVKQGSFADGEMQIRGMEQSRDMLFALRERLEKLTEEKGRLAVGLGAMSGLLLIIVLL